MKRKPAQAEAEKAARDFKQLEKVAADYERVQAAPYTRPVPSAA